MCHKETNTDWSPQVATGSSDQSQTEMPDTAGCSQSRTDSSHSSSIRRWQTFSPPGISEDSYGICKVYELTDFAYMYDVLLHCTSIIISVYFNPASGCQYDNKCVYVYQSVIYFF